MALNSENIIKLKFETLKAKEDYLFDSGALREMGQFKEDAFLNRGFQSFYDTLEKEIAYLPKNQLVADEVALWIGKIKASTENLKLKKQRLVSKGGKAEITSIHITYRRKLIVRLSEILELLANEISPISSESERNSTLKLSDFFESESSYSVIMNLFVEKGYCQEKTFIWKDDKNGSKGYLAAVIKHLHLQGYYKNNRCPTNEQIKEIAQNTFGQEIGIDTIKRASPDKFKIDYIPFATL